MTRVRPAGPRLPAAVLADLDRRLAPVDAARAAAYPGEPAGRQPVHTVYVPADRVVRGLARIWGDAAGATLDLHGPDAATLAAALGTDPALVAEVLPRVRAKLAREPVEDVRVDAEDGYRGSPDAEDADVLGAAAALGADLRAGAAPPFLGIRAKSLEPATRRRGVRTLDLFLGGLLDAAGGPERLPTEILLTAPKVTDVAQVEAMVSLCAELERAHGLGAGRLALELQVETPQAVLGRTGTALVAPMVHAAAGRCRGLHYGTYDYSAALGIAAAHQSSDHPAADHAKAVLQVAAAGTGARAVDGSTNVLPVGDRRTVHAAWRRHAGLVDRALRRGFYQGWDLHAAQLPTRYLTTYAFFRAALPAATARLAAYRAGTAGGIQDEPATARALASVLVRALDCGAVDEAEALGPLGLDRAALDGLAGRAAQENSA